MQPWSLGRQLLIVGVIALIGAAGWFGYVPARAFLAEQGWIAADAGPGASRRGGGRRGGRNGDEAVPVIVAPVGEARNDNDVIAVGTGRAFKTATLFAESEGVISALEVKAGEAVAAGAPILRLDKTKAELAVAVAQQRLALAERTLDRADFLKRRNVQSDATADDARTNLELARLELRQAEEALRDTVLIAPFAGVVSLPEVELGDRVTTATRVASIDDRSQLLIEFEVPEVFFTRMGPGTPITATTAAVPDREFEGALRTIDPRINAGSRTVRVRAAVPNEDDVLRPGMSFAVRLQFRGDTYISVPELALQYDNGAPFVWRVDGQKARKVPVKTVRRTSTFALVSGALESTDLVIVEGVQRVREGRSIVYENPTTIDKSSGTDLSGPVPTVDRDQRG